MEETRWGGYNGLSNEDLFKQAGAFKFYLSSLMKGTLDPKIQDENVPERHRAFFLDTTTVQSQLHAAELLWSNFDRNYLQLQSRLHPPGRVLDKKTAKTLRRLREKHQQLSTLYVKWRRKTSTAFRAENARRPQERLTVAAPWFAGETLTAPGPPTYVIRATGGTNLRIN